MEQYSIILKKLMNTRVSEVWISEGPLYWNAIHLPCDTRLNQYLQKAGGVLWGGETGWHVLFYLINYIFYYNFIQWYSNFLVVRKWSRGLCHSSDWPTSSFHCHGARACVGHESFLEVYWWEGIALLQVACSPWRHQYPCGLTSLLCLLSLI